MVKRYPYRLFVQQTTGGGRNPDGDWVAGSSGWVDWSACRDEANTKGAVINLEDGTAYTYDTLIVLPKNAPPVLEGTTVEVREGATVRVIGTAKRFVSEQLHCRLWV